MQFSWLQIFQSVCISLMISSGVLAKHTRPIRVQPLLTWYFYGSFVLAIPCLLAVLWTGQAVSCLCTCDCIHLSAWNVHSLYHTFDSYLPITLPKSSLSPVLEVWSLLTCLATHQALAIPRLALGGQTPSFTWLGIPSNWSRVWHSSCSMFVRWMDGWMNE